MTENTNNMVLVLLVDHDILWIAFDNMNDVCCFVILDCQILKERDRLKH